MHFYSRNRNGCLTGDQRGKLGARASVIITANAAGDAGIKFYRSAIDGVLSDGIGGVTPPRFIRASRLLPTYDLLRANEDRARMASLPHGNGNPRDGYDSEEENADAAIVPGFHETQLPPDEGWETDEDHAWGAHITLLPYPPNLHINLTQATLL